MTAVKCEDCRFAMQCYAGKFSRIVASTFLNFYGFFCPDCEEVVVTGHCFEGPACGERVTKFKCSMRWMTRKWRDAWKFNKRTGQYTVVKDMGPGEKIALQRCPDCHDLVHPKDPLTRLLEENSLKVPKEYIGGDDG